MKHNKSLKVRVIPKGDHGATVRDSVTPARFKEFYVPCIREGLSQAQINRLAYSDETHNLFFMLWSRSRLEDWARRGWVELTE